MEYEDGGSGPSVPLSKPRGALKWFIFASAAVLLASSAAFYLSRPRDPHAPSLVVVRACRDAAPGTRRIIADFGTQFDVSENAFSISAATHDMAPERFYVITLKNSAANPHMMIIAHDAGVWEDLKNTSRVFSRPVKKENILGSIGYSVGTDRWGYLEGGARWRYVAFSTKDAVGYRNASSDEAILFDQVIKSACR